METINAGISVQKPEAVLESETAKAVEESVGILGADIDADKHISESVISAIEMPVVGKENNDGDISEADVEMEELLNEVEQNIEESAFMESSAPQETQQPDLETDAASTDTAVITAGMSITGDVMSSGSMNLIGNITGNIEILGKLNVTGEINGNSSAAEIYAESAQINGEIRSKGSVKIGQSSVVIGNIFATSAVIAGAVKGDIDVNGPVILDTSAIVMGNIKSKSVQINNGAVIEGMCSQCYADVSPTSFFN
ncbi:MAG: polymer-forming cytoskeletal protein, partial [Lachnospiraceae bacterium]|nr:polymer-forming cytoskeletal protein [Lachnospiraceae bacterium]